MNIFNKIKKMIRPVAEVAHGVEPQGQGDDQRSAENNLGTGAVNIGESKIAEFCSYCNSKNFVHLVTQLQIYLS